MSAVSTARIFGAPHRYLQGPGALDALGDMIRSTGPAPAVIVDAALRDMLGPRIEQSCVCVGLAPTMRSFSGEITYAAVDALSKSLMECDASIVVGVGGGKTLDAAKAVSLRLETGFVTVPTIASNDSPTSAAIAMYDDDHTMIAVDRTPRSPEVVLVDTALISSAPVMFLRAGIGDALAKKFEAEGCQDGTGLTPFGTRPLKTGGAIASACFDTLMGYGEEAIADCGRGQITEALEAVVEAVVLMSGLGFENGGLSLAHSLTRGLVKIPGPREALHGDQVAWGALVQMLWEGRPDEEVAKVADFSQRIGLPSSLADLGLPDPSEDDIRLIADWTMTAPHLSNLRKPASREDIGAAILTLEFRFKHLAR